MNKFVIYWNILGTLECGNKWEKLTFREYKSERCYSVKTSGVFNYVKVKVRLAILYLFIYLFIYLFRVAPAAYGGSEARGQIRAVAASLRHSSQKRQILNPLSKVRNWTRILMDAIRSVNCWATVGTPIYYTLLKLRCMFFTFSCSWNWNIVYNQCQKNLVIPKRKS